MIRKIEHNPFRTKNLKTRQKQRNESLAHGSLCIVYRDKLGVIECIVDEQYGVSFDGTHAYFDILHDNGDSESIEIPVKNIVYIGDPKNYG